MKYRYVLFNGVVFMLAAALSLGSGVIVPDSAFAKPPLRGGAHMSVHHGGGPGGGGRPGGGGPGRPPGGGHGGPPPSHRHHDSGLDFLAGAVTGLAVGVIVAAASMPSGCSDVVVGGVSYRQCGSTWYQPCYQGTTVQYVVVNPPR